MNIAERAKDLRGHVGIYFKNLATGDVVNYNADDEYHPASVIKLPIVMAVYKMASEGKADLYEKLKVTYECRVPSCGAFNAFTDEPMVDIKTLCNLAIVISDNTASNMLVSHFGIENLNHEFKKMGLVKTHVERLFFDDEMQEKGYNNKAVPSEIGYLLEQIHNRSFISEEIAQEIWEIISQQQLLDKTVAYVDGLIPVGSKTGGARGITCDVALFEGERPYIISIMANETDVPVTDDFMRHLGRDIYKEIYDGIRIY